MRVLTVSAHPDDAELGAGATMAKHVGAGDEVYVLVMGAGAMSRDGAKPGDTLPIRRQAIDAARILGTRVCVLNYPDQRFDSVDFLELVKSVEQVVKQVKPEVVYTHHAHDLNLDHRLTYQATVTACRPVDGCSVRRIESFEVPSSTEWGEEEFHPTDYVDIAGDPLQLKVSALSCYVDEMRAAPHPRSVASIIALARWRGATAGLMDAEAFTLVREIR